MVDRPRNDVCPPSMAAAGLTGVGLSPAPHGAVLPRPRIFNVLSATSCQICSAASASSTPLTAGKRHLQPRPRLSSCRHTISTGPTARAVSSAYAHNPETDLLGTFAVGTPALRPARNYSGCDCSCGRDHAFAELHARIARPFPMRARRAATPAWRRLYAHRVGQRRLTKAGSSSRASGGLRRRSTATAANAH